MRLCGAEILSREMYRIRLSYRESRKISKIFEKELARERKKVINSRSYSFKFLV